MVSYTVLINSSIILILAANYKDQRMSDHLNQFSQSIEVNYETQNGEEILATVYFQLDPKVSYVLYTVP